MLSAFLCADPADVVQEQQQADQASTDAAVETQRAGSAYEPLSPASSSSPDTAGTGKCITSQIAAASVFGLLSCLCKLEEQSRLLSVIEDSSILFQWLP